MAQVEISINGREYRITCDDGQETRLQRLAAFFDRKVGDIAEDIGQIGEARLMMLAALTVCDELFEAKERVGDLEGAVDAMDIETIGGAARAVDAAVARVNAITERLEK